MPRERLPNRRPCITETIDVNGRQYSISAGFHPDSGTLAELWIPSRGKSGSDYDHELYAGGTLASLCLQCGARPQDIAYAVQSAGGHPSVIGAALDWAAKLEAEL